MSAALAGLIRTDAPIPEMMNRRLSVIALILVLLKVSLIIPFIRFVMLAAYRFVKRPSVGSIDYIHLSKCFRRNLDKTREGPHKTGSLQRFSVLGIVMISAPLAFGVGGTGRDSRSKMRLAWA